MAGPEVTTLVVRGSGGAYQIQDLPLAGTNARDVFNDNVKKGNITVVGVAPEGAIIDGENRVVKGARWDREDGVYKGGKPVDELEPFTIPLALAGVDDVDETELEIAALAAGGAPVAPHRNAGEKAWREYALAVGADENEIKGLKRDELRELFGDA